MQIEKEEPLMKEEDVFYVGTLEITPPHYQLRVFDINRDNLDIWEATKPYALQAGTWDVFYDKKAEVAGSALFLWWKEALIKGALVDYQFTNVDDEYWFSALGQNTLLLSFVDSLNIKNLSFATTPYRSIAFCQEGIKWEVAEEEDSDVEYYANVLTEVQKGKVIGLKVKIED
jgi:hypothetical protein